MEVRPSESKFKIPTSQHLPRSRRFTLNENLLKRTSTHLALQHVDQLDELTLKNTFEYSWKTSYTIYKLKAARMHKELERMRRCFHFDVVLAISRQKFHHSMRASLQLGVIICCCYEERVSRCICPPGRRGRRGGANVSETRMGLASCIGSE